MKKIKTTLQIFFIFIFMASCQSAKNVITGKEAQSKGEEFLVEKKNPLVVPPDFDQLPIPDEDIKSTQTTAEKNSNFEKLLKGGKVSRSKYGEVKGDGAKLAADLNASAIEKDALSRKVAELEAKLEAQNKETVTPKAAK